MSEEVNPIVPEVAGAVQPESSTEAPPSLDPNQVNDPNDMFISSMADLRKNHAEMYRTMTDSIARYVLSEMKKQRQRLKRAYRQ